MMDMAKFIQETLFRDSKVRGADGALLVLYHGTTSTFTDFDVVKNPSGYGNLRGFYFTSDRSAAEDYGPVVMAVHLDFKNPFIGNPFAHYAQVHGIEKPGFGSRPEVFAKYKAVTHTVVKDYLIAQGFDAVIIEAQDNYLAHDEYIAFNREQIKVISSERMVEVELEAKAPARHVATAGMEM
jgi:hypothetical protein